MIRFRAAAIALHSLVAVLPPLIITAQTSADSTKAVTRMWGDASEGQAISVLTNKNRYVRGERILLDVSCRNVGQESVRVGLTSPLQMYHVTVLLPDSKKAPFTLYGKQVFENSKHSSLFVADLKPGQQKHSELELRRLYDFSLDGKYTVRVHMTVLKGGRGPETVKITSNTIEFTVESAGAKPGHQSQGDGKEDSTRHE